MILSQSELAIFIANYFLTRVDYHYIRLGLGTCTCNSLRVIQECFGGGGDGDNHTKYI